MIRISIVFIALFFIHTTVTAQYKDAGMWTDLTLAVDLGKKWQASVSPEIRMNENITRVARVFSDVGVQYKINKRLFSTLTYRGGAAQVQDYFQARQRMQLGIGIREKIKDFSLTFQSRWQLAVRAFSAENDADFISTMRSKLQVKYTRLKGIDLATSFELFNSTNQYQEFILQNWRWMATLEKKINKRNYISVGYLIQKNLINSPQEISYVFLLSYQLNIEFKKNKEKQEKTGKEPKTL